MGFEEEWLERFWFALRAVFLEISFPCLVDVSDIFNFSALGKGRGSPRLLEEGGGSVFFN